MICLTSLMFLIATQSPASAPVRVDDRLLNLEKRVRVSLGVGLWARNDGYENPAGVVEVAWHQLPRSALLLRAGGFASFLSPGSAEVKAATGLIPKAHQPYAQLLLGYQQQFGYGKWLLESNGAVSHFNLYWEFGGGATAAFQGLSPVAEAGLGAVARLNNRFFVDFKLSVTGSLEWRRRWEFAPGLQPICAFGVVL